MLELSQPQVAAVAVTGCLHNTFTAASPIALLAPAAEVMQRHQSFALPVDGQSE